MNKIQFKFFTSIICTLLVISANTIAEDYYIGVEGGYALHDDMDEGVKSLQTLQVKQFLVQTELVHSEDS